MRVTNSDKNVEEKVNYFISRFNHFLANAGGEYHFEIENQLSLFEKIHFQIKNNGDEHKLTYVDLYFKNRLLDYKELWSNYRLFEQVKKYIDAYNIPADPKISKTKIKTAKLEILDSSKFLELLNKLILELKHKMPESLGKNLLSVIQCKYPLAEDNHISKLNFLAKMFVSGGFFSGKTSDEIANVISRVFYKDVNFPFPPEVKTRRQQRGYLAAGLLSNQLNGFTALLREDNKQGLVLMKLYGGEFKGDFEFEYDGVTFLGIETTKFLKVKDGINQELLKNAFEPGEYIYVCAYLRWFSEESIFEKMNRATKNQINYFSSVVGREFVLDYSKNFLIANKQWNRIRFSLSPYRRKHVDEHKLSGLNNNMMKFLKKQKNELSARWFLKMEPLFINANKSSIMSDFWIYLEALLPQPILISTQVEIKDFISTAILLNEKQTQKDRIIDSLLHTYFSHGGQSLLGVDYNKWGKAIAQLQQKKVPIEIRAIKDPFIVELLNEFDTPLDKDYYHKAKDYYYSILIEAYGNRNSAVHQGFSSDVLIIKLEKTLHYLIQRLRWIIADEIKIHPTLSFELLLEMLLAKSKPLLS